MESNKTAEGLQRVVGVQGLTLSMISITIGAGIFVLPAIVGMAMGVYGLLSYLFCCLIMAAIMLCYAEVGSRVTSSGGTYAYVEAAFGKFPGFVINWLYIFGYGVLALAALMNIIADSLATLFPVFLNPFIRGLLFFFLLGFMGLINIRGAKQGVAFVKAITIIKLLPLLAIIIFGLGFVKTANLQAQQLPSLATFSNTALVLFFAFAGFETALCVSGEVKNPKRTVPLSILLAGLTVLGIYLLLQIVVQGVLGAEIASFKDAPLAAVAQHMIGPTGATVILITTALSCFGSVTTSVLAGPRALFAGAKGGMFPTFLGKVHPKFATPHFAIISFVSVVFLFSISGGFKQLAILASAAVLIIYLTVILATLQLRRRKEVRPEKMFRMPGGVMIPLIGIAAIVWLLSSLSVREVLAAAVFIATVCVIYFFINQFRKKTNEAVTTAELGPQIEPQTVRIELQPKGES